VRYSSGRSGRQSADQKFRQPARLKALEEGAGAVDQSDPNLVGGDLAIEEPALGLRDLEHLGQKVVKLQDLDAAVAHLGDEVEMVTLRVLDPQNVVEQKLVAVARREAAVGQSRSADQDLAELANLGIGTKCIGGHARVRSHDR
jgi:hypothetical protein